MTSKILWAVISAIALAACTPSTSKAPVPSNSTISATPEKTLSERTPEQNLALIDGKAITASQPYSALLDEVAPKCKEDRTKIADMTVKSVELAKERGATTDNLDMLTGLRNASEGWDGSQQCSEIYATLVVIMTNPK